MAILSLELPNIHGFLESFERGPQLQLSCRQPCNWVIVGLCFSGQKRNFRLVKQLSKVVEPTQRPLMGDSAGAYNVGIWAQSGHLHPFLLPSPCKPLAKPRQCEAHGLTLRV